MNNQDFIDRANKIHNFEYNYAFCQYINSYTKVKIECSKHGIFLKRPNQHIGGKKGGCPTCSKEINDNKQRKSFSQFVQEANLKHNNKYNYFEETYKNSYTKMKISCSLHGVFLQTPSKHLNNNGCKLCFKSTVSKSFNKLIQKFNKIHNNKYTYLLDNYINGNSKITILCPFHGPFKLSPNAHIYKRQGCKKCFYEELSKAQTKPFHKFVEQANLEHNNKYIYVEKSYINFSKKMTIICPSHGEFRQSGNSHVSQKHGCPKCAFSSSSENQRKPFEKFKQQANLKHNNKYTYLPDKYINANSKMEIICPYHGSFFQSPSSHLRGSGCIFCCNFISKKETQWLNSLNVPERNKFIIIDNRKFKVDGYDPITNTVYEFYGNYWHGNPRIFNPLDLNKKSNKTYGELYKTTLEREEIIKTKYNFISIWEDEFDK